MSPVFINSFFSCYTNIGYASCFCFCYRQHIKVICCPNKYLKRYSILLLFSGLLLLLLFIHVLICSQNRITRRGKGMYFGIAANYYTTNKKKHYWKILDTINNLFSFRFKVARLPKAIETMIWVRKMSLSNLYVCKHGTEHETDLVLLFFNFLF